MLRPINRAGSKPPLFFIHGANGIMPSGPLFSRILGPDQPFYVINANGFDGSPPHQSFGEMVQAYYSDIVEVAPKGPIVLVAMCWGTLVAIEVGRKLLASGRELGPLVLFDPPRNPFGNSQGAMQDAGWAGAQAAPANDPTDPEVARQLYNYARGVMMTHASVPYNDIPFNARDPQQLHVATQVGIACTTALSRFSNPTPYFGAVELIINVAVSQFFFGRQMPWQRLLPNPHPTHVYPYGHMEWFRQHRFRTGRLLKFLIEGAFAREDVDVQQFERSFAEAKG